MHYKTIFISDIHLGLKKSNATSLDSFLKENSCDTLYLVGDIVDFEVLKNRWYFPKTHANIISRIIALAKKGTTVYWVLGNHDEQIRYLIKNTSKFNNITFIPYETTFTRITGEKYLVIHGDMFDAITRTEPKWGKITYSLVTFYITLARVMRFPYFGLATYLRKRAKKIPNQSEKFKEHISRYVIAKKLDGVICGHTHTPEIKEVNGITYMNDGDWESNNTALVEIEETGEMVINRYKK